MYQLLPSIALVPGICDPWSKLSFYFEVCLRELRKEKKKNTFKLPGAWPRLEGYPPEFKSGATPLHTHCLIGFCLLLVILTYLLTPWNRVLLEKLTGSAASQEIPALLEPEVSSPYSQVPATCPILSQLYPVPTPSSHFLKIHLNIILPSTSGSPQWSLSLRFPHQNHVRPASLPHTRHMPRPSHSSRFYHPQNIR